MVNIGEIRKSSKNMLKQLNGITIRNIESQTKNGNVSPQVELYNYKIRVYQNFTKNCKIQKLQ